VLVAAAAKATQAEALLRAVGGEVVFVAAAAKAAQAEALLRAVGFAKVGKA
jgi:hypothetical protein